MVRVLLPSFLILAVGLGGCATRDKMLVVERGALPAASNLDWQGPSVASAAEKIVLQRLSGCLVASKQPAVVHRHRIDVSYTYRPARVTFSPANETSAGGDARRRAGEQRWFRYLSFKVTDGGTAAELYSLQVAFKMSPKSRAKDPLPLMIERACATLAKQSSLPG